MESEKTEARKIRFTAREAGEGTVTEVRHGSSYGSTEAQKRSEVCVRHGPAPKKQKTNMPLVGSDDVPTSRFYLPYAEAKGLRPGQRVTIRVERA